MEAITIFWKDGRPCGTCAAGQEAEWGKMKDGQERQYDRTTSSTEAKWHAYARHRAMQMYMKPEDVQRNEQEAQRLL